MIKTISSHLRLFRKMFLLLKVENSSMCLTLCFKRSKSVSFAADLPCEILRYEKIEVTMVKYSCLRIDELFQWYKIKEGCSKSLLGEYDQETN